MENNTISLNIPESWSDVKIYQYQEFMGIEEDKTIETPRKKLVKQLSVLCDEDETIINKLPASSFAQLVKAFETFNNEPDKQFKNIVEVGGKKYGFQKNLHELTLGEWIDLEHYVTTSPIENLHKMLAVVYRPIVTQGDDFFDYTIKTYDEIDSIGNSKLFQAHLNIQDVYGVILFFLNIVKASLIDTISSSQLTSEETKKMMEEAMRIVEKELKKLKKKPTQSKKKKTLKNGNGSTSSSK
jgi:hypothetical protein